MKGKILKTIEDVLPELMQISRRMYENPEIGGKEKMASELLC